MSEADTTRNATTESPTAATDPGGALVGTRRAALAAAAAATAGFLAEQVLEPDGAEAAEVTSVNGVPGPAVVLPGLTPEGGHLPETVEIGSLPPTGVAVTDTANVKAALKAAGEANGVAVFNKPGTYAINEELVRPHTASIAGGPNTTFQAVAAMGCLLTDSKTEQSKYQAIYGGLNLDANNLANHALWCRYFRALTLDVKPKNSLEDDVILGDLAASGSSQEPAFGSNFLIQRTAGTVPVGHYCLWVQRAGDGRLPGVVLTGQETGWRIDSGGWRGVGVHPVGAAYPMQVCIDNNADAELVVVNCDTPTPKEHAEAAGSAVSSTITDSAILSQHLLRPVSGTNIPAGSFVGTVTSGVSFVLVNAKGEAVKPTGAVAGVTLAGVGIMQRTGASNTILGGQIYVNPVYGVDGNTYGIVTGPGGQGGNIYGFHAQGGEAGNYRVQRALTGGLAKTHWSGLLQVNTIEKNPENSPVVGVPGSYESRETGKEYEVPEEDTAVYLSAKTKLEATAIEIRIDGVAVHKDVELTPVAGSADFTWRLNVKASGKWEVKMNKGTLVELHSVYQACG